MGQYWWVIFIAAIAIIAGFTVFFNHRKKSDESSREAYIDGLRSIISGDDQTAFVKLRQAVDQDTENIDAYLKMGDLFREKGMIDKALQIHRELTLRRNIPNELHNEINKSLALDYIEANANDKAISLLGPMLKNDGFKGWAEEKILYLYMENKLWKEAEELYRGIMKRNKAKKNPLMANIKVMIGREQHNEGKYHQARLAYKEAISLDKNNPFPYIYIAESYRQEGRIDDGVEYLRKLCEEVPRYAYLAFSTIEETFFELGRFGEVEDIYRRVLKSDPDNVPAKIALAGILEKKGEIQISENLLRSILESDNSNSAAAIKLAKILAGDKRSEEGLEILSNMADNINLSYDIFTCKKCGARLKKPEPSCPKCFRVGAFL